MRILSLDIATKTGWATNTSSGVWNLKVNKGESYGMKLIRFKAKVKELIQLEDIELVVYEKPSGRFIRAVASVSEMVGVLIELCEDLGVEYTSYTVSEIKKHATGKGNANKSMMINSAKEKFDIEIIDDNHADALWILDKARHLLQ